MGLGVERWEGATAQTKKRGLDHGKTREQNLRRKWQGE